jgi:hypothetical protein
MNYINLTYYGSFQQNIKIPMKMKIIFKLFSAAAHNTVHVKLN